MMTHCALSEGSLGLQRHWQRYCLVVEWDEAIRHIQHKQTTLMTTSTDGLHPHPAPFLLQDLLPLLEQCEESDDVLQNDLVR